MNELYHHGVLGQKWGVRRYQNKDGSLTDIGRARYRAVKTAKTKKDVDAIIDSLNKRDRDRVLYNDKHYLTVEEGEHVLKRILLKYGDKPVAFFDILDDGDSLNLAMAVHKDYQGSGYGRKVSQKGMKWIEDHKDELNQTYVVWAPREDNTGSIKLAKENGFELQKGSEGKDSKGYTWVNYTKKIH